MINILHLTDFHYTKRKDYDQSVVFDALMRDISDNWRDSLKPDLIVFSGDLVDRADEKDVFSGFYDTVLEPILKLTRCGESRVILTPGNHDIHRSQVKADVMLHDGMAARLVDRDAANSYFLDEALTPLADAKLKGYRELRDYIGYSNVVYRTSFSSTRVYDELRLAVVQVNTAWLGYAGLDDIRDERKLVVPEAAIELALRRVPPGYLTLMVTHHPTNWLAEFSETDFLKVADGRVHAHLYGHLHEPRPAQLAGFKGSTLSVQGGALYQGSRKYYIGYSLVRIDPDTLHSEVNFRTFFDSPREFGPSVDLSPSTGGKFYSSKDARSFFYKEGKLVDRARLHAWIAREVADDARREFSEGLTDRTTIELFVPPPLYLSRYQQTTDEHMPELVEEPFAYEELVKGTDNYVILGGAEFGKTTLLQQLALAEIAKSSADNPRLPAYISFNAIKRGDRRIEGLIRQALPDLPNDCQLAQVLKEGLLTLLVDDVVFTDPQRMEVLESFMGEYGRVRYVLTAPSGKNDRYLSPTATDLPVHFTRLQLKALRRREMRALVQKWDVNNRLDHNVVLDRMLGALKGINVPLTAINGTILLSIYEHRSQFTPINRSSLIEHFIETLLEKGGTANLASSTFDYRNRMDFLSLLAKQMCSTNSYILPLADLMSFTRSYLDDIGLNYGPLKLIEEFISARIFSKRSDETILFRYRAFLEYFTAYRMTNDIEFKDWVTAPERYLGYVNELGYYSGLVRNDAALLDELGRRIEAIIPDVFSKVPEVSLLEEFSLPSTADTSDAMIDSIGAQLQAAPLTNEQRDEILEADLPHDAEGRQEVFRPDPKDEGTRWFTALVIYSSVLKNMELVPDAKKRLHLGRVLQQWGWLFMASLLAVPQIARTRHIRVNGVLFRVAVPSHFTEGEVARVIYCDLPNAFSKLVMTFLGTEKLERQLSEPDLSEGSEPRFITFLRNALIVDLRLGDWVNRMKSFMTDIRKNRYLLEASLWKVNEVYRPGGLEDKSRKSLQTVLGNAVADLKGGSEEEKKRISERRAHRYQVQDLVRRLKAGDDN